MVMRLTLVVVVMTSMRLNKMLMLMQLVMPVLVMQACA